jgi:hemerythrin superfamily protein
MAKEIQMDAIKFILREHNKIRRTFKDINKKSRRIPTKKKMLKELCNYLVVHETMEQKKWYPHFKKNSQLNAVVKHLLTEEKKAAKVIKTFKKPLSDERWEEKFLAFKKDVEHHASEEEKKLFPKVRKFFDAEELDEIGKVLRKFKIAHTS